MFSKIQTKSFTTCSCLPSQDTVNIFEGTGEERVSHDTGTRKAVGKQYISATKVLHDRLRYTIISRTLKRDEYPQDFFSTLDSSSNIFQLKGGVISGYQYKDIILRERYRREATAIVSLAGRVSVRPLRRVYSLRICLAPAAMAPSRSTGEALPFTRRAVNGAATAQSFATNARPFRRPNDASSNNRARIIPTGRRKLVDGATTSRTTGVRRTTNTIG